MLSSVTLDDATLTAVSLHSDTPTTKAMLTSAQGLVGIGAPRDSKRVRPQAHGGINETRWEDGRPVILVGEVFSTVGIEDALAAFRALTLPMLQTFDNAPALLKWTEGATGNQLQMLVKLDSEVDPVLSESQGVVNYEAHFWAEDPRAYSQSIIGGAAGVSSTSLSTSGGGMVLPVKFPLTFVSSGGGTVSVTNAGNRPTPAVFRIYGTCVNPQIVNLTTQQRIVLNGTVNAGDYLELDVYRRTIKLNGTTGRQNFYDPADSQWFDLAANGTSDLQLVAASFDASAKLTVLARSAYA